jgi:hypothetical protein
MLSGFKVRAADNTEKVVPVMYGDISRNAANVLRDGSENKIPSAPRISIYVSDLALDTSRLIDSSFISKVNIRERAINEDTNSYTNTIGQMYTVERIAPTPYKLTVKADIWTTNTEQKLQVLEQILVLFNPSFEIQTTDNYVDWTSLTAIYLDGVVFSNRTIPVGTDSDIDVATLTFDTPIWLTPPGMVKRLGVIQTIISNIFNTKGELAPDFIYGQPSSVVAVTPGNYGVLIIDNRATLVAEGQSVSDTPLGVPVKHGQNTNWFSLLDQYGEFKAGVSRIFLAKIDGTEIVGTGSIDPNDQTIMIINWDPDTYPTNTIIAGRGTIDAIVDPQTYAPSNLVPNIRYLVINPVGSSKTANTFGPDAWKNNDGSDFVANEFDIIEWSGSSWNVVFDSAAVEDTTYVTNLKTGIQYKWDGTAWTKSFEGEYMPGSWRLEL